jgi:sugar/nucleoside kinase (ribokinase family)
MNEQLLVAGSIALDTRDGPFGSVEEELGGSAVYFALAASLIGPVAIAGPVGLDAAARVTEILGSRRVDLTFLKVLPAPTYRWRAHQDAGRNVDLGNSDSIYDTWEPSVPRVFDGWAFVGSMRPDRQAQVMKLLGGARLLAADAMLSYVHSRPPEARDVLRGAGWYFCNHEEFEALGGGDPQEFRRRWSLQGLVVKAGPRGVTAYTDAAEVTVRPPTNHPVVDTTGAGDAVAGGMLARWLSLDGDPSQLEDALVWGVACASLTISDIGVRALSMATRPQLEERVEEVRGCQQRES